MNRKTLLLLSATLVLPTIGWATDDHAAHDHRAMAATSLTDAAWSDGTVKKVDKAGGKVTVSHGPLENLGMPAMTMGFRVKDGAWLSKLKEGQHIRFIADDVQGTLTIVRYEPLR